MVGDKPFRVRVVGGECQLVTLAEDRLSLLAMDYLGREHRDSAVTVVMVEPGEKTPAPAQRVLLAAEAVREARPGLHGLEGSL